MTKPVQPIDLIRKLIGFDTTSRESNLALIDFIADYLDALGIRSQRYWNAELTKANLWATIGPADRPGVILSGHTDVVPVDGQRWTGDPFTVREVGGQLVGRGTSDMKSFIALCLAKVPQMQARGLPVPIHLAFSYDEEIGCTGVRGLIADLAKKTPKPALCIVGEPTEMQVILGHKGGRGYQVRVTGQEAHSSLAPQSVNAIQYAAELVAFIAGLAREMAKDGPFDPLFDVPHTTISTGLINGGAAMNIVPKDCTLTFEFRYVPQTDPESVIGRIQAFARDALEPRMQAVVPGTGITFTETHEYPALDMSPDHPGVALVKALAGRNDHAKVAFGTEGGLFQQTAGIPTVVCGPGSIKQAHKPDEFIALEQVARCEAFLDRLLDRAQQGLPPLE
jgi:acetylornithine deacetylase